MNILKKILMFFFISGAFLKASIDLNSVSFNQAMQPNQEFKVHSSLVQPQWFLIKNLYDKYVMKGEARIESPRIPKIFHHIWVGSSFPEPLKNCGKRGLINIQIGNLFYGQMKR